jgi:hypothetical protein
MSKIKKGIAFLIVLLILIVIYVFIHLPMYREPEVSGLVTNFKMELLSKKLNPFLKIATCL